MRMRTTLILDDTLLKLARQRAAERDVSLSDILNEALRAWLEQPQPTVLPFSMITDGRGAPQVRHEPADFDIDLE
jgi:hypothetical protein